MQKPEMTRSVISYFALTTCLNLAGNPHDDHIERAGGGHDPEAGQDTCPGAK